METSLRRWHLTGDVSKQEPASKGKKREVMVFIYFFERGSITELLNCKWLKGIPKRTLFSVADKGETQRGCDATLGDDQLFTG